MKIIDNTPSIYENWLEDEAQTNRPISVLNEGVDIVAADKRVLDLMQKNRALRKRTAHNLRNKVIKW